VRVVALEQKGAGGVVQVTPPQVQSLPTRTKPAEQEHVWLPMVLVQTSVGAQNDAPVVHSSTSVHTSPLPM
jgi:hypothetical protein